MTGKPDDLNPSVWKAINEAVGEALGVSPPDSVQDRPPLDAPEHGASPARMVPPGPSTDVDAQQKVPDNGVRFQMVTRPPDAPAPQAPPARADDAALLARQEAWRRQMAEIERRNREAASRAHPAFHPRDGSLLGEYAAMQGDATTPDTVDGIWWLGLPKQQAIWELGLKNETEYQRVYRDIETMAYIVENRRQQTGEYIPLIIKRRKRRVNSALFHGGRVTRIRRIEPGDAPPPGRRPA